ncbi:UDP-glucuronic acid/UDP-N-acetylgalactosamine transporter, putative [Trypanosoma cruzi marinkellei]|uniref:UDP-glucuronic acid/UDP-N-acetylgalactosamine transporter, putative n=1 Tax=Trypanosoma cruzi marinkellei TaxID=85056 RepID=K2NI39_TRYCR|nr:UDP-glucuronic acid/UDP-N-acetylgalactosamine transporter, putative [Trypanosoma cruzi marinkellei]
MVQDAVGEKEFFPDPIKRHGNDATNEMVSIGVSDITSFNCEGQMPGSTSYNQKIKGSTLLDMTSKTASGKLKLASSLLFAIMSVGIMMITKTILTEFNFHCFIFVGFLQYVTTTDVLLIRRSRGSINFPLKGFIRIVLVELFPLPMLFMFNTLSGLGATQALNMPLFVLLRRLSIFLTLLGEAVFLHYNHGWEARAAVILMILGAFIATSFEGSVPDRGIMFVLFNDVLTALNGVITRMKMDENRFSSEGIMFYTNAFAALCTGLMLLFDFRLERTDLMRFDGWTPVFITFLIINAFSGFGITYATYLCTKLNSPLTVSMIGAGKNVFTSYVGMLFSDYIFSIPSLIGINVSVLGCLLYSHREFVRIMRRQEDGDLTSLQQYVAKRENP